MNEHKPTFKTQGLENAEFPPVNPTENPTMGELISRRFSRRGFLKGSLATTAIAATVSPLALMTADKAHAQEGSAFSFEEAIAGVDADHHVAPGYDADILLRWGDPVLPGAPEFDPYNQSAEAQAGQFGYNNDYVGYVPLDGSSGHGLLLVNHEYTNPHLMFPGLVTVTDGEAVQGALSEEQVNIELMAHGGSIVEIEMVDGKWQRVPDSLYNRRITAETMMTLSGPAAGHERLMTSQDATGTMVRGTLNNCAGGTTPWGTYLMAEENFHGYFTGELPADHREAGNYERLGAPGNFGYEWSNFHPRFDVGREPNEMNRFGWVVEVDPMDPEFVPVKRTALGRFKHEGAESIVAPDGRVVFYTGDDERFDYVYKFVTAGMFNPDDRAANMDLLDEGTLYVARFDEDGTMEWMPLVHGEGPLTEENGFASQADVVIETRRAADLLGATPMDRPEDIEPNASNGRVYVMLTNNTAREETNAANPRVDNAFGHIVEIHEDGGDFAATAGTWEILVRCGDPSIAEVGATFSTETTENGWFGMPDNCAVDADGRLWVSTDGNSLGATGRTDGLWALDTEGAARGTSKLFYRVPVGGEMCGPLATPDLATMFVAVQHPGDGGEDWEGHGRPSFFEDPSTRWPDFQDDMPVRPSVVAITKQGGGKIGSA